MKTTDLHNTHLCVHDKVWWKGSWGSDLPKVARVVAITLTDGDSKDGVDTMCVPWELVNDRRVIVDLDNGHWAYGFQITKTLLGYLLADELEYEKQAHAAWAAREE